MLSLTHTDKAIERFFGSQPSGLKVLSGGRNNRVLQASHPRLGNVVIKDYFREIPDSLERLRREWNYLSHLKKLQISDVPLPLFKDIRNGFCVFSYVKGRKLLCSELTDAYIVCAAQHIVKLSQMSNGRIDMAKGTHSTLAGHIGEVRLRMNRLREVSERGSNDIALREFLTNYLEPLWEAKLAKVGKKDEVKFETIKWNLSPSDFGFHNILLDKKNLSFIDFEYAGTDDLAKLTTDFMLAPSVPITIDHSYIFREYLMSHADLDCNFSERVDILYPIAQVKWICIILNDFIDLESDRKRFADHTKNSDRLEKQLALARLRLSQVI